MFPVARWVPGFVVRVSSEGLGAAAGACASSSVHPVANRGGILILERCLRLYRTALTGGASKDAGAGLRGAGVPAQLRGLSERIQDSRNNSNEKYPRVGPRP